MTVENVLLQQMSLFVRSFAPFAGCRKQLPSWPHCNWCRDLEVVKSNTMRMRDDTNILEKRFVFFLRLFCACVLDTIPNQAVAVMHANFTTYMHTDMMDTTYQLIKIDDRYTGRNGSSQVFEKNLQRTAHNRTCICRGLL